MSDQQPEFDLPEKEEQPKRRSFGALLRGYFLTGVLVIAPAFITYYILRLLVTTLDSFLLDLIPGKYQPEGFFQHHIPGFGLVAGFILVVLIGMLARNILGRKLVSWGEKLVNSIPGVRSIYGAIKQVLEAVAQSNSKSFREVVMVEYPRKGIWSLAFVTGTTKGEVQKITDDEMVNIFLPTTPNPTSGFLLFVPRKDLIKLTMTVDQGVKMVISAGIVTPTIAEGKAALKQAKKVEAEALPDK